MQNISHIWDQTDYKKKIRCHFPALKGALQFKFNCSDRSGSVQAEPTQIKHRFGSKRQEVYRTLMQGPVVDKLSEKCRLSQMAPVHTVCPHVGSDRGVVATATEHPDWLVQLITLNPSKPALHSSRQVGFGLTFCSCLNLSWQPPPNICWKLLLASTLPTKPTMRR